MGTPRIVTMPRAVICHEWAPHGSSLTIEDVPALPAPADGDVVVKLLSIGLCFPDLLVIMYHLHRHHRPPGYHVPLAQPSQTSWLSCTTCTAITDLLVIMYHSHSHHRPTGYHVPLAQPSQTYWLSCTTCTAITDLLVIMYHSHSHHRPTGYH